MSTSTTTTNLDHSGWVQKIEKFVSGFEWIAAVGFFLMVLSNFRSFVPIDERTWREIGVGLPVILASLAGIALILSHKFFASFFVAMFSAFFLTHEIIICYDNKAVEMGRELGPDGWFRSVAMIYHDALNPQYGAFLGMLGISIGILAIIGGWILSAYCQNLKATIPLEKADEQPESQELSDSAEFAEASEDTYQAEESDEPGTEEDEEEV